MTVETRMMWYSKEARELWKPRIMRVRKAYNVAELASVVTGMRRVFVHHIYSTDMVPGLELLTKNNLAFFPVQKSGIYKGFSHKHMPVEEGEHYMMYGAAVPYSDLEAGQLFTEYSKGKNVNHDSIGELLGYPPCCIDFFGRMWPNVSIDPIYEAAQFTEDAKRDDSGVIYTNIHPFCNNTLRYFGIRITPHLPCSMQCEETIKWGDEWIDIMRQSDGDAAEWAIELLSMPTTWDCYRGVAIIDTPIFRGVTNSDKTDNHKIVENAGWDKDI